MLCYVSMYFFIFYFIYFCFYSVRLNSVFIHKAKKYASMFKIVSCCIVYRSWVELTLVPSSHRKSDSENVAFCVNGNDFFMYVL